MSRRLTPFRQAVAVATTKADVPLPARGVQTEEETLLLYEVVQNCGSSADFAKLIESPVFNPLAQFRRGRKELFQRVVAKHKQDENWEAIFELCKDCLSSTDDAGQPTLLASDWTVWQQFIGAAAQLKSVKPE